MTKKLGYIYLLREREFVSNKENVQKLGMTILEYVSGEKINDIIKILNDYKRGSQIFYLCYCAANEARSIESDLKKKFKQIFDPHPDGNEYFIGDPQQMVCVIMETFLNRNKSTTLDRMIETDFIIDTDTIIIQDFLEERLIPNETTRIPLGIVY